MLMTTKKYKEFLFRKEAIVSLFFSLLICVVLIFLYKDVTDAAMTNTLKNILVMLIPGLIGLLGFLVTGLAMMASIITREAVRKIDEMEKAKSLAGILFSFYFEGFVIGLNILCMIFSYIILDFPASFNVYCLIGVSFFLAYIFWFSILYAISLLGTCINFFFVNVYYTGLADQKKDE